jgi:CHAT domain-containing protein
MKQTNQKKLPHGPRLFCLGLIFCLWFIQVRSGFSQTVTTARQGLERNPALSLGERRTDFIIRAKPQAYPLQLETGQYLKVTASQDAINLSLQLFNPEEKQIAEVSREGKGPRPEVIEAVSLTAGTYTLVVIAMEISAQPLPFDVSLTEVRVAAPRERQLAQAEMKQCEAQALRVSGKPAAAIDPALAALALRKEILSENHYELFDYAEVINLLGNLHREAGNLVKALPLFEQCAQIWRRILPSHHPSITNVLNNLGLTYQELEDFDKAEKTLQETLALVERRVGPKSLELAAILNNLGLAYRSKKNLEQSEICLRRVVELFELANTLTINMGSAYLNLGGLLLNRDKDAEAETILKKAWHIYDELKLSPTHPLRPTVYLQMATAAFKQRNYPQAETLALRAREIFEQAYGAEHWNLIGTYSLLASIYRAMGKIESALEHRERANEIREKNLQRNITIGSERQKLAMVAGTVKETHETLSLHAQAAPNHDRALRLAFLTWLRRKGRALDETQKTMEALRHSLEPEAGHVLDQLFGKINEFARLAAAPTGEKERATLARLDADIERLQADLSQLSARFQAQSQSLTLARLQAALPPNTVLVEFARYEPVETGSLKKLPAQYLAYLFQPDGVLRWVPLGAADVIERNVEAWRRALAQSYDPNQRNRARKLARILDAQLMQPLRAHWGSARRLFLSPDGLLNLIPVGALVDERGQELLRNYELRYLTSGRDLLRLEVKRQSTDDILIIGAPDYDNSGAASNKRSGQVSRDLPVGERYKALPSAVAEAQAVKSRFPQAQMLLGAAATESAVKQAQRPTILHLITHGVFLPDQNAEKEYVLENPLLRSWLALAGANQRKSGNEDGILTAYEAAALDLWGTKLVTLSACETGIGEIKNGEGVFGLRRALVLAGAETQLTSLWKVNDLVTSKLMKRYYAKLAAGAGRAEALRHVQLEMLKSKANQSPYYWAGFITIGEWANLQGVRQ